MQNMKNGFVNNSKTIYTIKKNNFNKVLQYFIALD